MKIDVNQEFPCGMKQHIKAQSGVFDWISGSYESDKTECPLHGKNCKPTKK